jgi:hypothetical protein
MEIRDISVSVERLDDVRGGQNISVRNLGLQIGANQAASSASGVGVGNQTVSSVNQFAPQSFSQTTGIAATEVHRDVFAVSDSWLLGGGFYY